MPADLIENVPLLSHCTQPELAALLAESEERTVPAGTTLAREGDDGAEFVVILDGTAEVSKNGLRINRLGTGDFLGEISVFSGARRTATVTTTSKVRLLALTDAAFRRVAETMPSFRRTVLAELSERLQADAL
jgi:CRP-like cAMP-binding protein